MNLDSAIPPTIRRSLSQDSEAYGKIEDRKRGFRKRNVRAASCSNVTTDFREPSNLQKLPHSDIKELTRRHTFSSRDENEITGHHDGGKSVLSYSSHRTASTVATSGTSSTCPTLASNKRSPKPEKSKKRKEVTWEDMLGKGPLVRRDTQPAVMDDLHFEAISLEANSIKAARKMKDLERELKKLETSIPEACKMELAYLNQAGEVKMKRDHWKKQLMAMRDHPTETIDDMKACKKLESKIEKSRRVESLYLKKSKELHDRRYRWTQQYEYTIREWEKLGGEARVNILLKLPPVRPPTVVGSGSRRVAAVSSTEN